MRNYRPFTAQEDKIIRLCAADGLSYSECGERLNRNRNMIAGRAAAGWA